MSGKPVDRRSGRTAPKKHQLPDAALLGVRAETPGDLRKAVELGLEYSNWESIQSNAGLTMKQMADVIQMNVKTIARRKGTGRFTSAESDRLSRLSRILAQAIDLFEGDKKAAQRWLASPRQALGGSTPLELIRTELGAREVENLIGRLENGVFS